MPLDSRHTENMTHSYCSELTERQDLFDWSDISRNCGSLSLKPYCQFPRLSNLSHTGKSADVSDPPPGQSILSPSVWHLWLATYIRPTTKCMCQTNPSGNLMTSIFGTFSPRRGSHECTRRTSVSPCLQGNHESLHWFRQWAAVMRPKSLLIYHTSTKGLFDLSPPLLRPKNQAISWNRAPRQGRSWTHARNNGW